ncbi:MAG: outer membrane beta-barrel protein [Bacteroidetes bacterium]|nr:outer membrane beta-barrel protein [Bacteroidota bacterium]
MKKHVLFFLLILSMYNAAAQESTAEQTAINRRFFVGASWSFMSVNMKLSSLTLNSVWYGSDLGTSEFESEEIDNINGFVDRHSDINALTLEAGVHFLNKPGNPWKLSGTLLLGIAQNLTTVHNNETGIQEYSFNSGFSKPCLGVGFNFGYQFTPHWSLSLRPNVVGTMGTITNIDDQVNPDPVNFTSVKKDQFSALYLRSSLMAGYTTGPVTIMAGPGFYYLWSKHKYSRNHTNINDGQVITEEATYVLVPCSFIDGSLAVSWKIIPQLTIQAHAGIGMDIMADGGIQFDF